jgi:predicted ATPase
MIYARKLTLPGEDAETNVVMGEKRTCFHTFYPFKIFPEKGLRTVEFDGITLLYGGNGSGKSTLINVMAHREEF